MDYDKQEGGVCLMGRKTAMEQLERLERIVARFAPDSSEPPADDFILGAVRNRLYVDTKNDGLLFTCAHVPHVTQLEPGRCHVYLSLPVAAKLTITMREGLGIPRKRTRPAAPGAPVRKRQRPTTQ